MTNRQEDYGQEDRTEHLDLPFANNCAPLNNSREKRGLQTSELSIYEAFPLDGLPSPSVLGRQEKRQQTGRLKTGKSHTSPGREQNDFMRGTMMKMNLKRSAPLKLTPRL